MTNKSEHQQLADQIEAVNQKVDRKHKALSTTVNRTVNKLRDDMMELWQPVHDYVVGQKAIKAERGANPMPLPIPDPGTTPSNGTKIPPIVTDLVKIIGWLVLGLLAFLGIKDQP